MNELKIKSNDADTRYLASHVWHDGSPECFRCTIGPAVLGAAYGNLRTDTIFARASMYSLDVAIRDHQRSDGAIIPAGTGEGGPDIQTIFFSYELAHAYLIYGPRLDASHREGWSRALTKAADFLIKNGNVEYYINGNINIALAATLDMTHQITGHSRFREAADTALAFAMDPRQDAWPGFGLIYTVTPTAADGSDGRAYFAESGETSRGYDPSYTLLQVNLAASWFLVTNSAAAKRITNLLFNQLMLRVRASDWTIDIGGGTRKTKPDVRYGFYTAALPVLALRGGRSDLVDHVESQVLASMAGYDRAIDYPGSGTSFNLGVEWASTVWVVSNTPGW